MVRVRALASLIGDGFDIDDVDATNVTAVDRRWQRRDPSLERAVMNSSLAAHLEDVKAVFNRKEVVIGELFVTDTQGMLVATTDRTSNFYQGDEVWWKHARNGSAYIAIERDKSVGEMALTVAVPIRNDGRITGVLKVVKTMQSIEQAVSTGGERTSRFFYLMDGQQLLLTDASTENRTALARRVASLPAKEGVFQSFSPITGDRTLFARKPVTVAGEELHMVVEFDPQSWLDVRINILRMSLIQVFVFILLFAGLILVSDRRLFRPITSLTEKLERMSMGETEVRIDQQMLDRDDEIGELACAFDRLMTSMKLAIDEAEPEALGGEVQELKERIQMLEPALNEAPIGIVVTDPDQDDNPIVYAGQGFLRLTGYDEDEVEGRNCRFLQGEDTDEETVAEIANAIEEREPITTVITNYRKSGEAFQNLLHIRPVMEDGELRYFVGFQIDISSFEQIEAVDKD